MHMRFNKNILQNIKNYKAHSIFVKSLLLEIILSLVPFLAVSGLYYSNVKNTAQNNVRMENKFVLNEISDITDTILSECDMLCTYIGNNDSVQMFMINDWFFDAENRSLKEVDQMLRGMPLIYKYIDSIYIYSEYNRQINSNAKWSSVEDFRDIGWMDVYRSLEHPAGVTIARTKNNSYPYLISIVKPVFVDKEKKGAIVLNINSANLYKTVSSTKYDNLPNIYLTSSDGNILMSGEDKDFAKNISELYPGYEASSQEMLALKNFEKEEFMVSDVDSSMFGLRYVNASPMTAYTEQLSRMQLQIILLLLLILFLCLVFAFFVSIVIYKPVEEIIRVLDHPEGFDVEHESQGELKYIMTNILTHIRANEEMKQELEQRFRLLNKSQIGMLQAQINPHFLYNTLETINWMAVDLTDSENDVSNAISSLAKLLRSTINEKDYIISIDQELEYTNHYMDILELRYSDMFQVEWELDDGIGAYAIVKICLQPVIENAVYHGLKPKGAEGVLKIRGQVFDQYILFEVQDNGVGMEEQTLKRVNERLHARDYIHEGRHIGLYNINHRIRIIFGDEYGVYVTSNPGGGTCVGITIPKIIIK